MDAQVTNLLSIYHNMCMELALKLQAKTDEYNELKENAPYICYNCHRQNRKHFPDYECHDIRCHYYVARKGEESMREFFMRGSS